MADKSSKGNIKAAKGKKKKKEEASFTVWDSESDKVKTLKIFEKILSLDLKKLWNYNMIDERFLSLFSSLIFQMMENPQNTRSQELKKHYHRIISLLSLTYGCNFLIVNYMINNTLCKYEHAVTALSSIITLSIKEDNNVQLLNDTLNELGKLKPSDLVKDNTTTKNIATFIEQLSSEIPNAILPLTSHLMGYLDGEAYLLRNGVVQVIAHLLNKAFDKNEVAETSTRDSLFEELIKRFHDVTSHTRSKVLQAWSMLAKNKTIPLKFYFRVTENTVSRLFDKTVPVRKNALRLFTDLLDFNPFGPQLSLSVFQKQVEKAKSKIEEISAKELNDVLAEEEDERPPEVEDLMKVLTYSQDAVKFIKIVHNGVKSVSDLLGSKNESDVKEAIKFLETSHKFLIAASKEGIKKMLSLIWFKEESIRNAVIDTYVNLYFTPDSKLSATTALLQISKKTIKLTKDANLGDLTSLEELIASVFKLNRIPRQVADIMWGFFESKKDSNPQESRGALIILSMMAKAEPSIIKNRLKLLVKCLESRSLEDHVIAKYACLALQKLSVISKDGTTTRFKSNHQIFLRLTDLLKSEKIPVNKWFSAAEQAINTIYTICDNPDQLLGNLIKSLTQNIFSIENEDGNAEVNIGTLSRFLFIVGHCALKQLVFIEEIYKESIMKCRKEKGKLPKEAEEAIEKELGDGTEEMIENLDKEKAKAERDILKNLLGAYSNIIVAVCSNAKGKYKNPILRRCAVLALIKFMIVNSDFCEKHLQLLFSILEGKDDTSLRANIVVSIGDLLQRWPNLIQPYTSHIYRRLRDPKSRVRKNTFMMLTHLILNDMVKMQVSEMALSLEDDEPRIASLARLFFHELAGKADKGSNAIYNVLPDVLSTFSKSGLDNEKFKNIIKFLFTFVDKEKQLESLITKLCLRFKENEPSNWKKLSFCLSMITYNDKTSKKFIENFKHFKEALIDNEVYNALLITVQKAKKVLKNETKAEMEELESKMTEYRKNIDEEDIQKHNLHYSEKKVTKKVPKRGTKRKGSHTEKEHTDNEDEQKGEDDNERVIKKRKVDTDTSHDESSKEKGNKQLKNDISLDESDEMVISQGDEEIVRRITETDAPKEYDGAQKKKSTGKTNKETSTDSVITVDKKLRRKILPENDSKSNLKDSDKDKSPPLYKGPSQRKISSDIDDSVSNKGSQRKISTSTEETMSKKVSQKKNDIEDFTSNVPQRKISSDIEDSVSNKGSQRKISSSNDTKKGSQRKEKISKDVEMEDVLPKKASQRKISSDIEDSVSNKGSQRKISSSNESKKGSQSKEKSKDIEMDDNSEDNISVQNCISQDLFETQ